MIINKIKYISKILIVSFLLSFTLINNSDVFATNYEYNLNQEYIKSFGGNGEDEFIESFPTIDGGFIAVGDTSSTNIAGITIKGESDALIVKYDKDGSQEWIKSFGGSSGDIFYSVTQTNDNSFVVVGWTISTDIEGMPNKGKIDIIMAKYDESGNQEWIKSFGGNGYEYIYSITKTNDNGFIIVGGTNSTDIEDISNKGGFDSIIIKYDKDGNQEWIESFGGNNYDCFASVVQTNDNGFIVVGETSSTNIAGVTIKGASDTIVIKYNKDGNKQWIKSFGGYGFDYFYSVTQTNDNGFIIVGYTYSTDIESVDSKDERDGIIVKYDESGNQEWIKSFGGNDYDCFYSVIQINDNGFIAIGYTSSTDIEDVDNKGGCDGIIVKYDKSGNQEWIKSFGGNNYDCFTYVIQTNNNGFIVVGYTYSTDIEGFYNKGGTDAFIIKYTETKTIIPEEVSNNLNIEIVSDNSLELSISTNKISFEGYNGVEDLTNDKLSLTVSSGLYYDLYATLDSEIRGTNDTNAIIDKSNLKIKTSDDLEYKSFNNIGEKVNIVANHKNGRDFVHNINLKLLKDSSVKADTYQTNITFEVVQK